MTIRKKHLRFLLTSIGYLGLVSILSAQESEGLRADTTPTMPEIVRDGDPEKGLLACSICHQPSGSGNPESAALTGLSEEYLYSQLKAFKSWDRGDWTGAMMLFGMPHTDENLRKAAKYFAAIEPGPVVRVEEAEFVPETFLNRAWLRVIKDPDNPRRERIGQRIITLLEDEALREFVSYVPSGALELGERIANQGTDISQPCISCHGTGMKGTALAPFIAGQYPDYLFRQLRAFKWGARRGDGDYLGQMQEQVRYLSEDQLLAVSAYIGSLPRDSANRDFAPVVGEPGPTTSSDANGE